jgi:hypothetical protein
MPIPELLHCGDFGLGTLDHLDGELIVLDGRAYQVREGRVQYQVCRDWLIKLDGRRSDRRPLSNQEKQRPRTLPTWRGLRWEEYRARLQS